MARAMVVLKVSGTVAGMPPVPALEPPAPDDPPELGAGAASRVVDPQAGTASKSHKLASHRSRNTRTTRLR
jgi:hypothetical protein